MKTSQDTGMIDTSLFPYETFPVRLEIPQENRIAWFSDDYNLQKYLSRVKLKPKDIKVLYRDERPDKAKKKELQQGTTKTSSRSTGGNRRNTKDVDAGRTPNRTRKSKSK
jgi:hypothetical protein